MILVQVRRSQRCACQALVVDGGRRKETMTESLMSLEESIDDGMESFLVIEGEISPRRVDIDRLHACPAFWQIV